MPPAIAPESLRQYLSRARDQFFRSLKAAVTSAIKGYPVESPSYGMWTLLLFPITSILHGRYSFTITPQFLLEADKGSARIAGNTKRYPDFGVALHPSNTDPSLVFLVEVKPVTIEFNSEAGEPNILLLNSELYVVAGEQVLSNSPMTEQVNDQARFAFDTFPSAESVSIILTAGPMFSCVKYERDAMSPADINLRRSARLPQGTPLPEMPVNSQGLPLLAQKAKDTTALPITIEPTLIFDEEGSGRPNEQLVLWMRETIVAAHEDLALEEHLFDAFNAVMGVGNA
ncbi:hypothetical protein FA95DRAFT_1678659 [Auriscalpium vulgare]|uniref:Uncharacterized protein n=1 Tax=Auriscalpium vulgare TaxID=40419 RepID=A0ACB8RV11_9AGAM|nr:hypothetical protein FA95DRAFT_1678659 [Auriscalpium vulgare]